MVQQSLNVAYSDGSSQVLWRTASALYGQPKCPLTVAWVAPNCGL
jgi:hypothetical protein